MISQPASLAMRRTKRAAIVACASMLTLVLQGSGVGATAKPPVTTTARLDPAAAEAAIPTFDLVDLRNARRVDLAGLRTPARAMLVWLWAPG